MLSYLHTLELTLEGKPGSQSENPDHVFILVADRVDNHLHSRCQCNLRRHLYAVERIDGSLIIQRPIRWTGPGHSDSDAIFALPEDVVDGHAGVDHLFDR
jgi:hypothetical protein